MPTAPETHLVVLGTGRFLRSVLLPPLLSCYTKTSLFQPRGTSFLSSLGGDGSLLLNASYEVDTIEQTGETSTITVGPVSLISTLSTIEGFDLLLSTPNMTTPITTIGVGLTEAGVSLDSPAMRALLVLLMQCHVTQPAALISIIGTDNVPNLGDTLQSIITRLSTLDSLSPTTCPPDFGYVQSSRGCAASTEASSASSASSIPLSFAAFLKANVTFHNTMVDRIVAARPAPNPFNQTPSCEPIPFKALCIEDSIKTLPAHFHTIPADYGIHVRADHAQLEADITLKLLICNGTHTPLANLLAASGRPKTTHLTTESGAIIGAYLLSLFESAIAPALSSSDYPSSVTDPVYADWSRRLHHPSFGLSSFFITQNNSTKYSLRHLPTLKLLLTGPTGPSVDMALAVAAMLVYSTGTPVAGQPGVYRGTYRPQTTAPTTETTEYTPGLSFDATSYTFKFPDATPERLHELASFAATPPLAAVIEKFLTTRDTDPIATHFNEFLATTTALYQRLYHDGIDTTLRDIQQSTPPFFRAGATPCAALFPSSTRSTIHYAPSIFPNTSNVMSLTVPQDPASLASLVASEVSSTLITDLHTHLLPPSHFPLCQWGIDSLLTYHYLIAEYFLTAPSWMTPSLLYSKTIQQQATLVWDALFVKRSPISEACRGVCTVLVRLGLADALRDKDLGRIRQFYANYLDKPEAFSDLIFEQAGIKYAIMTNIPFDSNEAAHWRPQPKLYSANYRSALRVDPLLVGDTAKLMEILSLSGYEQTLAAARQYLRDWAATMKPEYMMASTPKGFDWQPKNRGINENNMQAVGAFASANDDCCDPESEGPTLINEQSDLLEQVLIPVCEELGLPIALKIGANRAVNPELGMAGDGLEVATTASLERLCRRFPKVKFLATFLSLNNQHEAIVLTSKFRNLHLYGCWWFVNNPSMIENITTMRLEMLGLGFTFQHSDCRVLDQLLYKWAHSRACLSKCLTKEVLKMIESGAVYSRGELRRDCKLLCGGSYDAFVRGGAETGREVDSISELVTAKTMGCTVVDLRDEDEKHEGVCEGSLAIPWSTWTATEVDGVKIPPPGCGIPEDKEALVIVHCRSGGRGGKGKVSLMELGYRNVLNGAGPQKKDVFGVWAK